jgi:NAD(P)-dependent dehydrogenase (short-subunit alcohol dehydrogenase family)
VAVSVDLGGKTALVTGASRGIGFATARELAAAGANVVLTSRDQRAADRAAMEIGTQAIGFAADAADHEAAVGCVTCAVERFGSLDILVNNAGTNTAFGPLLAQDRARFATTLDVNVWAPILWTGLAWSAWMSSHGGAVINTASLGGLLVGADLGVYNASKAALIHITRQLALELAPMVRVNAVAPGIVRTKLAEALWRDREAVIAGNTPLGRIGEPRDIATVVAFLASDSAGWMTGQTLVIDGGWTLRPTSISADSA